MNKKEDVLLDKRENVLLGFQRIATALWAMRGGGVKTEELPSLVNEMFELIKQLKEILYEKE